MDETVGFEPTINLIDGDEVYLELGSSFTPRATALDVEDGDLTDNIYISSDVDTSKSGEYTVRYSVVDSSGNSVYRDQIVYVGNFGDGYADDSGAYDDYEYDYSSDITIDDFKAWYRDECGGEFDPSLYEPYSGEYRGDIDCSNRGLGYIDLTPISIFTSVKSINLSHNSLSEIDFSPLSSMKVIEKLDLSYNEFSYIDFSPLYNLENIDELWINGNSLNYTREDREELYRGFNNRSFTIYFKPHQ